jgi:hypothetical protein
MPKLVEVPDCPKWESVKRRLLVAGFTPKFRKRTDAKGPLGDGMDSKQRFLVKGKKQP